MASWVIFNEGSGGKYHDDVIKWKHFPRYWSFVRGIHRSPVNSLHKGQWRGALMLSLICVWINGWAHYDIIVMTIKCYYCENINPPTIAKLVGCRPFHTFQNVCYMLCNILMLYCSHNQVSIVATDDLVIIRHQSISNHRDDFGRCKPRMLQRNAITPHVNVSIFVHA